jgi:hypothetical protein
MADLEDAKPRRRCTATHRARGIAAYESADSKFIYYAKTAADPDIWKMNFEDKQETAVSCCM